MVCTWFGELCYCSCLPALPRSCLAIFCKPFFSTLYITVQSMNNASASLSYLPPVFSPLSLHLGPWLTFIPPIQYRVGKEIECCVEYSLPVIRFSSTCASCHMRLRSLASNPSKFLPRLAIGSSRIERSADGLIPPLTVEN